MRFDDRDSVTSVTSGFCLLLLAELSSRGVVGARSASPAHLHRNTLAHAGAH